MAEKPKPTRAEVRKVADELQSFVLSDKVQKAIADASRDPAGLKRAKADPQAFLMRQGVAVPAGYTLRISGTVTICITACGTIFGVRVCVQVCGTIRF